MTTLDALTDRVIHEQPTLQGSLGEWQMVERDKLGPLTWQCEDLPFKIAIKLFPVGNGVKLVYAFFDDRTKRSFSQFVFPEISDETHAAFAQFLEWMDSVVEITEHTITDLHQKNGFYKEYSDRLLATAGDPGFSPHPDDVDEPAAVAAPKKTWRDTDNEAEIAKLFPYRPSSDDVLDLYAKAKQLRSNRLMTLVKDRSARIEALAAQVVANLIESD